VLEESVYIKAVHYPGLPSHPDHEISHRILSNGFGAVMAFELDAPEPAVERFLAGLRRIRLVHTLGGLATTLSHAVTMTHRLMPQEQRLSRGIHDSLFRLAVGIEDLSDITEDLSDALARM
jgi:cystathionine gamma-synthase